MKKANLFAKMILTTVLILSSAVVTACHSNRIEKPETLNQPLPAFLSFVAPAPQTEYSVEEYNQGQHYPKDVYAAPKDAEHRICTEFIGPPSSNRAISLRCIQMRVNFSLIASALT